MNPALAETPWVVFRLQDMRFAVPISYVREMTKMPPITRLPEAPTHIQGIINFREKVIPVADLRILLGLESQSSELDILIAQIKKQEKEHRDWLQELENSVRERREFKLALDPHECNFGQWYDSYSTNNPAIKNFLLKFNEPHLRLHIVATRILLFAEHSDFNTAQAMIDEARTTDLAAMSFLFAEFRELMDKATRDFAIVLQVAGKTTSITVDRVESIETFADNRDNISHQMLRLVNREYIYSIGQLEDSTLVYQLDVEQLFGKGREAATDCREALPTSI